MKDWNDFVEKWNNKEVGDYHDFISDLCNTLDEEFDKTKICIVLGKNNTLSGKAMNGNRVVDFTLPLPKETFDFNEMVEIGNKKCFYYEFTDTLRSMVTKQREIDR